MTRDFIKYFLILYVFLFCATGLMPALLQKSGSYHQSAKSFTESVQSELRSPEQVRAVLTRLPLAGTERRTTRLLANENEVQEDYFSSKKGIIKYTSTAAAFAFVFQPSSNILRGVFVSFTDVPDSLSNKVYLLIQVFRI